MRGVWLRPCEFKSRHPHFFSAQSAQNVTPQTTDETLSVVFVSNGPGELATWVRPLAEQLHRRLLMRPRASSSLMSLRLVLVPCPNATGTEAIAADRWHLFERITKAKDFWSLLLRPSHFGAWPDRGVVVFLGGDQFWSVLLSARLGYRHITYAEWVARWPRWNDRIAAMAPAVRDQLPRRFRSRCRVVGDLMADLSNHAREEAPLPSGEWVALLPGSKPAKLSVGVPFLLETADRLRSPAAGSTCTRACDRQRSSRIATHHTRGRPGAPPQPRRIGATSATSPSPSGTRATSCPRLLSLVVKTRPCV